MTEIEAFVALVQRPSVPLDEATAMIANVVRPPVDISAVLHELDRLAAACEAATLAGVRDLLFEREEFCGNDVHYADPENSMIDAVLQRKVGIPITLSIVMIEVGRRLGVELLPVSMPGHFLVLDSVSGAYCDPFARGASLDAEGCKALHDQVFLGRRALQLSELVPVGVPVVLARVLNNLEQSSCAKRPGMMDRLLQLHCALPGLPPGEHMALASRFAAIGQFGRAAKSAERCVGLLDGADRLVAQRTAAQYWARTN